MALCEYNATTRRCRLAKSQTDSKNDLDNKCVYNQTTKLCRQRTDRQRTDRQRTDRQRTDKNKTRKSPMNKKIMPVATIKAVAKQLSKHLRYDGELGTSAATQLSNRFEKSLKVLRWMRLHINTMESFIRITPRSWCTSMGRWKTY